MIRCQSEHFWEKSIDLQTFGPCPRPEVHPVQHDRAEANFLELCSKRMKKDLQYPVLRQLWHLGQSEVLEAHFLTRLPWDWVETRQSANVRGTFSFLLIYSYF